MRVETRNKPKCVLYKLESVTRKEAQGSQFTPLTMEHLNDSNQLLIEFTKTEGYIYIYIYHLVSTKSNV